MFDPTQPPNTTDYTTFLLYTVGIPQTLLPTFPLNWVQSTLAVAVSIVNESLQAADGSIYLLAVYNLATDRLINYATDLVGQTYFQDLRKQFGISTVVPGVVSSSSDQGTSSSYLNIESMRNFTLQDLQTMKTPYGRQYMAFAQMYGPSLWGIA